MILLCLQSTSHSFACTFPSSGIFARDAARPLPRISNELPRSESLTRMIFEFSLSSLANLAGSSGSAEAVDAVNNSHPSHFIYKWYPTPDLGAMCQLSVTSFSLQAFGFIDSARGLLLLWTSVLSLK